MDHVMTGEWDASCRPDDWRDCQIRQIERCLSENRDDIKIGGQGATSIVPEISKLADQLRTLRIVEKGVEDISNIAALKQLEWLVLQGDKIDDFSVLGNFKRLRELDLKRVPIDVEVCLPFLPLLEIANLTGHITSLGAGGHYLRRCVCRWSAIVDNFGIFPGRTNLEELFIEDLKTGGIEGAHHLKKLKSLNITAREPLDLSQLDGLPNLKNIHLGAPSFDGLEALGTLPKLTNLSLVTTEVPIGDWDFLGDCSVLERLDIEIKANADISGLANLEKLLHLDLSFQGELDLSPIRNLRNLWGLRLTQIDGSKVPEQQPRLIGPINLERLSLSGDSFTSLEGLASSRKLKVLSISAPKFRDLSYLTAFPSLEKLFLIKSAVTDLSPLRKLRKLRTIDLSDSEVCDISALGFCKRLMELNIERTKVTDISPLLSLRQFNKGEAQLHFKDTPALEMLEQFGVKSAPSSSRDADLWARKTAEDAMRALRTHKLPRRKSRLSRIWSI